MPPEDPPLLFQPGDPFRQFHYVIRSFLGAGASGQVYRVDHRFKPEPFALKVSHLADRRDAKRVAAELIAAQASYAIRHYNCVAVHDLGCEDDGLVWQIQELLQGLTVAEILHRGGALSPVYAVDLALEAAWGLQAAHDNGVVHRDVKPSNVFLTWAGRVVVIDFSLAKVSSSPLKTTAGRRAKGTLAYMAPEHIRGAAPAPGFDVYALGTMLWEMLAGRHAYENLLENTALLVAAHLGEEPASLGEVAGLPPYVDEVVRRAIAKDPRLRYASMWELGQALRALRERMVADPDLEERVRHVPAWERRCPIVQGGERKQRYAPPRPPAPAEPPPYIPSARVYVPGAPAAKAPKVAATVPMEAVSPEAPPGKTTPMAVEAPLTRRWRPRAAPRWVLAPLVVTGALAVAAAIWLTLAGPFPTAPAARPPPSAPPLPSASARVPRSAPARAPRR